MSEMISGNGAVRDPNAIAASEVDDGLVPTPVSGDPAMMPVPEISMEEAEDILEETGPILPDPKDPTQIEDLEVSLSSSLEQLNNVRKELTAHGYINRSEAAMLKNLTASAESISGFFERHPVSSFTEMDSKVNYAVTCESLGKSVIDTVISIIKTIYKYIISIAKWFVSFLTGRRRKDIQNDQADKAIEKKNQQLDQKAERTPVQVARIEAMLHKVQPQYSRLVELMVSGTVAGAGDPLAREELTDFANRCASTNVLTQLYQAKGANVGAAIGTRSEQPDFSTTYGKLGKVCHAVNLLPLTTMCNYTGLLEVVKTFRAHIALLASKPADALLDEAGITAMRTFNKDNSHTRFNALLPTIQSAIEGNELTLKTIDDQVVRMQRSNGTPVDFFESRQRAAVQVKEKQLILQELTQIQSIFATVRDRTSQIALEYARARSE